MPEKLMSVRDAKYVETAYPDDEFVCWLARSYLRVRRELAKVKREHANCTTEETVRLLAKEVFDVARRQD